MDEGALQNIGTRAQIFNRLKQRHNRQANDTCFLTKELHFQQVAQAARHADNVAGDGLISKFLSCLVNGIKGRQDMHRFLAQLKLMSRHYTWIAQEILKHSHSLSFVERAIISLE